MKLYHGHQSCYIPKDQNPGGIWGLYTSNLSSKMIVGNSSSYIDSYCARVIKLMDNFKEITFYHIPREESQMENALAIL